MLLEIHFITLGIGSAGLDDPGREEVATYPLMMATLEMKQLDSGMITRWISRDPHYTPIAPMLRHVWHRHAALDLPASSMWCGGISTLQIELYDYSSLFWLPIMSEKYQTLNLILLIPTHFNCKLFVSAFSNSSTQDLTPGPALKTNTAATLKPQKEGSGQLWFGPVSTALASLFGVCIVLQPWPSYQLVSFQIKSSPSLRSFFPLFRIPSSSLSQPTSQQQQQPKFKGVCVTDTCYSSFNHVNTTYFHYTISSACIVGAASSIGDIDSSICLPSA
ncbi:hypothetical protein UY3_06668 [Chelonia mydas]|uniref:Uncharacterized protein n=1 Tax=Chelonia mydas TaxID=8469 RepID=M7BDV2_CHEMY|nr:hypothetical protein UY3_06668 [Chelonia mydas]